MEASVGVLRATHGALPAALPDAIDAALLRDLAAIAGIPSPVVSPVDYAEVQLSVGCADESRACLASIARAAGVDALLVRSLSADEAGSVRLELRFFDSASRDEPTMVSTEAPAEASDALVRAVPGLVRELFGIPAVAAPAARDDPEPSSMAAPPAAVSGAEEDEGSIGPGLVIGAGAAVLTAGIIIGATAADDFSLWKKRPIQSTVQAEQANADYDDLEARALVANVLMPVGAVVLALGATWLVIDLAGDDASSEERATLALEPRPDGAFVRVRGPLGGGF